MRVVDLVGLVLLRFALAICVFVRFVWICEFCVGFGCVCYFLMVALFGV